MKLDRKYNFPVRGHITVFQREVINGEIVDTDLLSKPNLVVNTGADVMALAVSGQSPINGMYMAYENSAPPIVESSPVVTRAASYYHTTGSTDPRGFVRVPTVSQPDFTSSDPKYNNNQVTFVAISDSNVVIPDGGNAVTDGTSQFYGAALLHLAPTGYADDILFAAATFSDSGPSEFEKIAGAQLGVRWTVEFDIP
jgi:hypothetical protein